MRTRATLRSAEFGFFGVVVYTRVQTPRRWGAATFFLRPLPDFRPGVESFFGLGLRPLRMSWLVVGMRRVMLAGTIPLAVGDHAAATAWSASRAGVYSRPWSRATGSYVSLPAATFKPSMNPESESSARCTPSSASLTTNGIVAFVSAYVDVIGTAPGMLATQ